MIFFTVNEGTGILRLNINETNSLDLESFRRLSDTLGMAEDAGVRALVIESARPGVFSQGLNLAGISAEVSPAYRDEFLAHFYEVLRRVYCFSAPVIAAVTGHAMGYGAMLAIASDFRFGLDGARIGLPEVKLGIAVPALVSMMLRDIVGGRIASQHVLDGTPFKASEAGTIGLFDDVFPGEGDVILAGRKLARRLAKNSHQAIVASRAAVRSLAGDLDRIIKEDLERSRQSLLTGDAREGIAAAIAGRRPVFSGA